MQARLPGYDSQLTGSREVEREDHEYILLCNVSNVDNA